MSLGKKFMILAALSAFGTTGFAADRGMDRLDVARDQRSGEYEYSARPLKHKSCEDLAGEITKIERICYPNGEQTHIKIRDEFDHEVHVILGPSRIVNSGYLNLKEGDYVELEGYEVVSDKGSMWVATRIQKGACYIEIEESVKRYGSERAVHGHDPCCAPGYERHRKSRRGFWRN